MIGKRKKTAPTQRTPLIVRQKQPAFHYSSNRSQTERSGARNDHKDSETTGSKKTIVHHWLSRPVFITGLAVSVLGAGYFSLLTTQPQIRVSGSQKSIRSTETYTSVTKQLTDNLLSHSKLTINRQKITNELQAQFPELVSVDVSTPLFSPKAVVTFTMARPELVLRGDNSDSFVLDNRGVVLFNARNERTNVAVDSLIAVSDRSNTLISIGKPALTTNQVSFIAEVKRQSESKQLVIESTTMTAGGGELNVRYNTVPYTVKYSLNEDARKSFGTFFATKEYLDKTNTKPAEYIDVRIAERAYIK